jgi:hypothetical protein
MFDDVTKIVAFINPEPWLNFDPSDPTKINGFAINLYLISGRTQKGVFGAGTIRVVMYEDTPGLEGRATQDPSGATKPAHQELYRWELPPERAEMYRVMRRPDRSYVLGDAYQLRLSWRDLELRGKRVAVRLEYLREDGQIVRRRFFWLRIPEPDKT